ncbi:hypothetical protein HN747_05660 [archaeon]|jgi:hypothetical protein|nr:hypothetical protein [archaeon]
MDKRKIINLDDFIANFDEIPSTDEALVYIYYKLSNYKTGAIPVLGPSLERQEYKAGVIQKQSITTDSVSPKKGHIKIELCKSHDVLRNLDIKIYKCSSKDKSIVTDVTDELQSMKLLIGNKTIVETNDHDINIIIPFTALIYVSVELDIEIKPNTDESRFIIYSFDGINLCQKYRNELARGDIQLCDHIISNCHIANMKS